HRLFEGILWGVCHYLMVFYLSMLCFFWYNIFLL
ncbi:MAG: hypothetical protein ACI9CD_001099, partial [Candidatus Deianiraeaceae bacterium]